MALQTLTSSGPASTPTGGTDGSSDAPPADLSARNSVPFSFLVAFLALFVVFMGLGLWARRIVLFARRRLGLPVPDAPPPRRRRARPPKPALWDVCPAPDARAPARWAGMQPLAAWYCRAAPPADSEGPQDEPAPTPQWPPPIMHQRMPRRGGVPLMRMPSPAPQASGAPPPPQTLRERMHGAARPFREWWLDIADPMRHTPPKDGLAREAAVDRLQVAVLVLMPSVDHGKPHAASGGLEDLGELAIGIYGTEWDYDSASLDATTETRT
ncbi:hypothetical protein PsYK624_012180 [Phanerochaete sordida]|uniref:Uncharacterized protein n=1 Tax=Phanerochaete sordida TaxID=48140 RepID=A0A9P3FZS7_9APHY|nr:hypothetical protein PsYK624_012180 [Phanerochaete sordida]